MKHFILKAALFIVSTFIILELFFRFVIPASNSPYVITNSEYHFLQFDTSRTREGTFTSGRFAQVKSNWNVNNYGWNSKIDYQSYENSEKPCIGIIGDSYIEGFYINWEEHIAKLLGDKLSDRYNVYSFGISGGNLSQFNNIAKYTYKNFDPELLIFFINGGDISSSLVENGRKPLSTQYKIVDGEITAIPAKVYKSGKIKRILRNFALVRYMYLNANLVIGNVQVDASQGTNNVSEIGEEKLEKYYKITDYILDQIRTEFPDKKIMFLADADRKSFATSEQCPDKILDSKIIGELAGKYNFYYLDLTSSFYEDYMTHRKSFNFDHNYHWNQYANKIASEALFQYISENVELDNY